MSVKSRYLEATKEFLTSSNSEISTFANNLYTNGTSLLEGTTTMEAFDDKVYLTVNDSTPAEEVIPRNTLNYLKDMVIRAKQLSK